MLIREMQREGIEDENLTVEYKEFAYSVYDKIGASEPQYWVEGVDPLEKIDCEQVLAAIVQMPQLSRYRTASIAANSQPIAPPAARCFMGKPARIVLGGSTSSHCASTLRT